MTVINLYTADQHLIAAQKVKIASGDVESVQLQVVFDDAWNDYSARTAVFHTLKNTEPIEMLLTDDACVVPHEVLAEAGTLFIGVRGATLDGTAIKTSTLVKYKIEQGADAGYTTLNPTMDLYQQFLAALDEKFDPFTKALEASLTAKVEQTLAEQADTIASLSNGVELWTNPDITMGFGRNTIALDLSEYTRFKVIYAHSTSDSSFEEVECIYKGKEYKMLTGEADSQAADVYYRKFTITNEGVDFQPTTWYGNNTKSTCCIPYKIIGFKYGGIATA